MKKTNQLPVILYTQGKRVVACARIGFDQRLHQELAVRILDNIRGLTPLPVPFGAEKVGLARPQLVTNSVTGIIRAKAELHFSTQANSSRLSRFAMAARNKTQSWTVFVFLVIR